MSLNTSARFFLGANSPTGFYSLYSDFVDSEEDRLCIIKSGPGSGKSSFMRAIASGVQAAGMPVEYIHCSGDPDSLDGVYFPTLRTGYVDGTSPHVIEPKFAGTNDNYVCLSQFYDTSSISKAKDQIIQYTHAYKACYKKAFDLISSLVSLLKTMPDIADHKAVSAAIKRTRGIINKEMRSPGKGLIKTKRRFLSAITCKGYLCFYDTVPAYAQRIYLIDNNLGLAPLVMDQVASAAEARGYSAILCPSPLFPDIIEHVILPELSLAFVSQTSRSPYPTSPFRHVRLDAVPGKQLIAQHKPELRRKAKLAQALKDEAVSALKEAKMFHDKLESAYNPYVNFNGVMSLAETHLANLLN